MDKLRTPTKLKIEYVPIENLTLYQRNPRRISRLEINRLIRSIRQDPSFFDARPCLVNEIDGKLEIYAGQQRYKAAKRLRWKKIPCFIEKDLNDEAIKRRLILDNRHNGEWDYEMLACDFEVPDLLDFGFTRAELDLDVDKQETSDVVAHAETKAPSVDARQETLCPNCGHVFTPPE